MAFQQTLLLAMLAFFQLALCTPIDTTATSPIDIDLRSDLSIYEWSLLTPRSGHPIPDNSTSLMPRTFNLATLSNFFCWLPSANAPTSAVDYVIGQLWEGRNINGNWINRSYASPRSCTKVQCTANAQGDNAAVYLCNDRYDAIEVDSSDIGFYAAWIRNNCQAGGMVNGQLFDVGSWNVIVRKDNGC